MKKRHLVFAWIVYSDLPAKEIATLLGATIAQVGRIRINVNNGECSTVLTSLINNRTKLGRALRNYKPEPISKVTFEEWMEIEFVDSVVIKPLKIVKKKYNPQLTSAWR